MRLHRLEFIGVGPFRDRQEVDFDELSESGLFLIDGPTGSGKTTIIDAIVYALFGDVSGGAESTNGRMRSTFCGDADPTGVVLEFTVDGRRHRVTRVPMGARDPQQPGRAPKRATSQVLTELDIDGSERLVLVRSAEVRQHIEDLLEMNSEQFRQLVVLPQGRFADLLRMSPNERLAALASLLDHNEFFTKVQDDLKAAGARADALRHGARTAAQAAAQQLAGRLRIHLDAQDPPAQVDFTDPSASDGDRRAAVEELLGSLSTQADHAAMQRDAQEAVANTARTAATSAQTVASCLAAVVDAQEAVHAAEQLLDPADTAIPADAIAARIGILQVQEGTLGEHAEWESQEPARASERMRLSRQESGHREAAQALRERKAALPGQRVTLEAERAAAQKLAGTAAGAALEEDRLAALVAKADELAALEPRLDQEAGGLAMAETAVADAAGAVATAHQSWIELVERQRGDQAARLASTLEPGTACPVCGSVEHPAPALPADGRVLVADAAVTSARTAVTRAQQAWDDAAAALTTARASWLECEREVTALRGALGERTPATIRAEHAEAVAARLAADEAQGALSAIDGRLAELASAEASLDTDIADQDTEANLVQGMLTALAAAQEQGLARVRAAIGEAESATVLLATTHRRIAALSALQDAHAHLAAATATVPAEQRQLSAEQAREMAQAAASQADNAEAVHAALADTAATLASTVSDASPLRDGFVDALAHRRDVDAQTAAAITLAQLATGTNSRRLPLRSYALQRRFEAVLSAATVHLERMSSGKFSFELDDQASAGHAGLGIFVHDAWTGHRQDPKSLSGGETFYAALSLALGLADVVRGEAGGSALETLFIDEGFGSLDQDTLYQVLDQLDAMRSGGRVVGVISHVTEMKESIPDRIEVRRGADRTSTVRRPSGSD